MRALKANQRNLSQTAKAIKEGKIIICPTDTVYGLVCDATNKEAVTRLFKIKKRQKSKPLPIFVKDMALAKKLALIDKEQEKFLRKVWFGSADKSKKSKRVKINPKIWAEKGKVTVVLKRKSKEKIYGLEKDKIALRIPDHKLVKLLLKKTNLPLTGTSANISGELASTKIKEIIEQFENQKYLPDLILDQGNLKPAKPSLVVDLTCPKLKILRK